MMYKIDTLSLRKAMIDAGIITIVDLADKANVNRNTVAGVLNGKVKPTLDVMYAISEALSLNSQKAGEIFFCKSCCKNVIKVDKGA